MLEPILKNVSFTAKPNQITTIVGKTGSGKTTLVDILLNDEKYLLIKDKILSYLPQTSIVGRILDNNNEHIIVKSDAKAFMQHDIYSWEVKGTSFIQIEEVTKESEFAYKFIKDWLEKTDSGDRERFINIVYDILVQSDINSFVDLPKLILTNTKNVLKTYKNISEDDVRVGLSKVVWHARFEILSKNPLIIADGGHNPEGVNSAINSIKKYFGDEKVNVAACKGCCNLLSYSHFLVLREHGGLKADVGCLAV